MDVLGYPLSEIGAIMDASVPAVKSAFHRGRTRLHELAREPGDAPPPALSPGERTLLARVHTSRASATSSTRRTPSTAQRSQS